MTMKPGKLIITEDVVPYAHLHFIESGGLKVGVMADHSKPHPWAIVARQVAGWRCLAVGEMPDAQNSDAVVESLVKSYGTGSDYLPREQFALTGPDGRTVHLRRVIGEPTAYCDGHTSNPYVHVRGRYFQHCMKCTTAYCAENFGRHPFEEH